ncbi:unnamed protein product [Sphagnum balticum]
MMLSNRLKFGFNILNALRSVREAVTAPRKHLKSLFEPAGLEYSVQTNLTAEGFDEVSSEWQAHFAGNPYDLQTYNYLENAQLNNFGTVDNPNVVFTADAPFRFVGCSGPQNEDDYESHELMWIMLREGPLQRCMICGQVFKLVRLRNEFSSEMDYYAPNFNQLWFQDLGESEITNNLSLLKANTHFEHTHFENPENTVYSFVSSDEHDRILTDPAYRIQRKSETDLKAKIYVLAMEEYEKEKEINNPWREPLSKLEYENLIQAEVIIRKLDRQFRQLTKFHARRALDSHEDYERRNLRMVEGQKSRFEHANHLQTIQKYVEKPEEYEKTYLELL